MLWIKRLSLPVVLLALLWWPAALAEHLGERYHMVDGLDVYLGIAPVDQVKDHPGELPKGKNLHHILVAVFDRSTGQRVDKALVEGRVSALSPRRAERLRIGYASGQFAGHATGHLVQDMFCHHDRRRFEIIGYGLKPSDGSELRRRIVGDMDIFHDLSGHSDRQAADTMRRDRLDVLVDLDGFVSGNRNRVFALRGATLQVS